jgi:hypothetical protein
VLSLFVARGLTQRLPQQPAAMRYGLGSARASLAAVEPKTARSMTKWLQRQV